MRCLILVNSRSPGIYNGLTYETGNNDVQPGSLVRVSLRKKIIEGIVLSLQQEKNEKDTFDIKSIEEVLGATPLLFEHHIKLVQWMSSYYYCSLRGALTPFLPVSPWRNAAPREEVFYKANSVPEKVGKKQAEILDYLTGKEWVSRDQLRRDTGASATTISSLLQKGILSEKKQVPDETSVPSTYIIETKRPTLTSVQKEAYESIAKEKRPSLLFGITGSGKTEVYASLIADTAVKGKQSILLVPEILLTEHTIHHFQRLFDRDRIAVIHSRLTPAAKRLEWMRIRSGEAALVIGSRSALFAPCKNLGLVIIDEEHEWTYKNEQTPRYHARETAEKLCEFAGAKLVMGTATPSMEAWWKATYGHYHVAKVSERYMNRPLPQVKVVDLAQVKFGSLYPFSPSLIEAMEQRLQKKEQIVLFLNRRGIASAMLCLECRKRLTSPDSQLPFTVHRTREGKPYLLDHIAGVSAPVPTACPHCKSTQLLMVGAGTQRLEDVIASIFPKARVLRADSDSLMHPEQMRDLLSDMRERKADILLGTQSVVKGLDLPGVTLAAVLIADIGMSLPHFRAGERVFQLLTQLTGRSGRAVPGEVIIQTFRPDAAEVVAAANHRTEEYLTAELALREKLHYPPFVQMIRFTLRDEKVEVRAKLLHQSILREVAKKNINATATVAPTLFGMGKEWHVLLKGEDIRAVLSDLVLTDVTVDIDPIDVI